VDCEEEQLVVVGLEEREEWEGRREGIGRFMMRRRRVDKDEGLSPLSPVREA
jgi:hypothetical protein